MQNEKKIIELPIEDVLPNRFQPRIKFDQSSINDLALSIKRHGVIQPIVVRQIGTKYEIIAGERRYKASVLAGKKSIPAIISELSDKDSVEIALIENVQREDLTPIEKAISYKKILDMGYIKQEELAQKVGKSQSTIANTLRLLNLTDEVQEALLENKISERHARSLLKVKEEDKQVKMLNRIISERLTVRKTDEEIDKMYNEETNTFTNEIPSVDTVAVPANDEIVSIPDTNVSNPVNDLPGFMNIDNIEQNATDINVEPVKPAVDMNQLLNASGLPQNNSVDVYPQPSDLQSNKFFSFFDEKTESSSEGEVKDIATEIPTIPTFEIPSEPAVKMPTFEVPSAPAVEVPTFEVPSAPAVEVPTFEVPSAPTVEVPTFEEPSAPAVEVPTFEVPSAPAVEVPTFEVPSAPAVEMPTFEVPSAPAVEVPTFEEPSAPTVEVPTFKEPSAPAVEMPTFEEPSAPVVEMPTFEVPSAPAVEVPTFEIPSVSEDSAEGEAKSIPMEIPNFEIPDFEIPEGNEALSTLETQNIDIPNFEPISIPAEEEIIPTIEVEPIANPYIENVQAEEVTGNFVSVPTPTAPNIKLALDAIRQCEATLENLGFVVDIEELDFDNNYQVTFKIQK